MKVKSIFFAKNKLFVLDQTSLPQKEKFVEITTIKEAYSALKKLKVRGAPLIGVFAAYALYVSVKDIADSKKLLKKLKSNASLLKAARPTAVNLFWAIERMLETATKVSGSAPEIKKALLQEAKSIHLQDQKLCENIACWGVRLISKKDAILTHCNTGFLATAGMGTALGVIYRAFDKYGDIKVYVDETRPLLQGARLTAWELKKYGVPAVLISDNMAGFLMQKKKINKIIVGADRITKKGDVANKIGTYSLAVLARYHRIPFYVAAPFSSFDLNLKKGENIPIEQRKKEEVRTILRKCPLAPSGIEVWNPAFDITPASLISAIITDRGVIYPPFEKNIRKILGSHTS